MTYVALLTLSVEMGDYIISGNCRSLNRSNSLFSGSSAQSCGNSWWNCSLSSQMLDLEPIIWRCVLGPKISLSGCHTPRDKRE